MNLHATIFHDMYNSNQSHTLTHSLTYTRAERYTKNARHNTTNPIQYVYIYPFGCAEAGDGVCYVFIAFFRGYKILTDVFDLYNMNQVVYLIGCRDICDSDAQANQIQRDAHDALFSCTTNPYRLTRKHHRYMYSETRTRIQAQRHRLKTSTQTPSWTLFGSGQSNLQKTWVPTVPAVVLHKNSIPQRVYRYETQTEVCGGRQKITNTYTRNPHLR